jgi:dolichyl-phosphate-mannose--protein O-mannosyl transferase
MAEGGSKTLQEKDHCQVTLLEGDVVKLSHENTGLEALHFHGKAKQFKV